MKVLTFLAISIPMVLMWITVFEYFEIEKNSSNIK